jgi:Nif-specific regulatory protein
MTGNSLDLFSHDDPIDRIKQISTWVSSINNLDHLLELVIETATQMMNAKASSLMLLDEKSKKLYFKVATGEKKHDLKKFEVDLGKGIAGFVAQKGEPLLIPDVGKDTRWYREISDSIGFQTHSIACVPMKVEEKIIGVVELIDKTDESPFTDNDMNMLAVFSELAATAIGRAQKIAHDVRNIKDLKKELGDKYQIIGDSKAITKVISDAFKVANSKTSALILGESGTGKELLARLIHRAGPRKDQPLIILNCAALTETLLEDELFGHEKGSFTGAVDRKIGKFELGDQGTIFLDEIGEMSQGMQAKLLRVLQEGMFYRVGGASPISVDVRVISATNRKIATEVAEGRFREDLYYRLNTVEIKMPSLRERKEDIPLLSNHFLEIFRAERGSQHLSISPEAMENMLEYSWPGNIREMKNALERAVVMGNGKNVLPEDLPIFTSKPQHPNIQVGITLNEATNNFKKEFITLNLKHTSGNRSKAAKIMKIQRTYLSRLISKYELHSI